MTIPQFFTPAIHPQVVQGGPFPQQIDLPGEFVRAFLAAGEQKAADSRSSAQMALEQQRIDLLKEQLKVQQSQEATKQAALVHQQEVAKQTGEAQQMFLEHLLPIAATTGALSQFLPQPGQTPQGIPSTGPAASGQIVAQQPQVKQPNLTPNGSFTAGIQAMLSGDTQSKPQDPFAVLADVSKHFDPTLLPEITQHVMPIIQRMEERSKFAYQQQHDADELALRRQIADQDHQDKMAQLGATNANRDVTHGLVARSQFLTQTKNLRDRGALLQQALLTASQAAYAPDETQRKLLMGSALANFVQASDQKVQLRSQILEYFTKHVDSSIKGNLGLAAQRLASGQYPTAVYAAMINHLHGLLDQSKSEFDKQRAGFVKTNGQFESYLPTSDEFFTSDLNTNPASRPPVSETIDPNNP